MASNSQFWTREERENLKRSIGVMDEMGECWRADEARRILATVNALKRGGEHVADCDFAGTSIEFRCDRCAEFRALLAALEGKP